MFKITLSPQYSNAILTVVKSGNVLTINGTPYDFTPLNDGDEIPSEAITNDLIIGGITKREGVVSITMVMPYSNINAPEHIRFPVPIMLVEDGEVIFNEEDEIDESFVDIDPELEGNEND
ncbi:hypothetical protein ACLBWZ_16450 [Brucellaceae bacterium C25G]